MRISIVLTLVGAALAFGQSARAEGWSPAIRSGFAKAPAGQSPIGTTLAPKVTTYRDANVGTVRGQKLGASQYGSIVQVTIAKKEPQGERVLGQKVLTTNGRLTSRGNFVTPDGTLHVLDGKTGAEVATRRFPATVPAATRKGAQDAALAFAQKKVGPDLFLGRDTGQNTKNVVIVKNGVVVGVRVSTGDAPDRGPQFQDYVVKFKNGKPFAITPKP